MASMLSSYLGNLGSLSEMMGDGVGGRGEEGGLSGWQAAAEQGDTLAGTALSMQEAENKLEWALYLFMSACQKMEWGYL